MPWGTRSQWLQPWRAYLDTPPADNVTAGLGINFNVTARDAAATATALEHAGFHRARVEIGWSDVDPDHPGQLAPAAAKQLRTILSALFQHHLRPLILLNANAGAPTPTTALTLHVLGSAPAGSDHVVLDGATIAQVVPGRTGFNSLTGGYKAAASIITAVVGDVATLSTPLPRALTPGDYSGSTLEVAPFTDPSTTLPGAGADFARTLAAWLSYVQTVTGFVQRLGHGSGFDVEVWNELGFGSDFLNINNYYSPPIDPHAPVSGTDGATDKALLAATANLIHERFAGVQVGDGFSDQVPWASGQTVPPGVQIDKHYYAGTRVFPQDNVVNGVRPVDWLGRILGTRSPASLWTDTWVPSYSADFPEYYLTGIQTETLVRDLTPLRGEKFGTVPHGGAVHGRFAHPPGAPAPQVWMTEYNLTPPPTFTPAQAQRFHAKVALRYLLAFMNKGLGLVDFYAAEGEAFGLLPNGFFASIGTKIRASPGLTLDALSRIAPYFRSVPGMRPRSVKLLQISTTDERTVFNGEGPYPALRNLDVAAFFPFQEATHSFVFAAYVMTRDLARAWQNSGPHEYDMPPAPYRFVVGGVDGCNTELSAYDPLAGKAVPVQRIACTADTLTLQTDLTDSPILIQAIGA